MEKCLDWANPLRPATARSEESAGTDNLSDYRVATADPTHGAKFEATSRNSNPEGTSDRRVDIAQAYLRHLLLDSAAFTRRRNMVALVQILGCD